MRCPACGRPDSRVLDSRPAQDQRIIRRRRECEGCGNRFTTYERVEEPPLVVTKKDNRREAFDSRKIVGGLLKACEKRPVTTEAIENLAAEVEQEIRQRGYGEVPSSVVGELVMDKLRRLDKVAYVRFASVYREFKDLEEFKREVDRLR
ncbi:MAG: transcriptional repressor NrdR [Bacillota bacterium]|nr:MAG: transcriptional repressor NrdR [Bacillota bacterium]